MSVNEEDFSDEEEIYDRGSEVYLGFTDVAFSEENEEPSIEDTFIGGQPIWLHENSTPEEKDLQCDNCTNKMALLIQAFAPREDKPYDRVIYIFACKNTQICLRKKGSVKAIRGISKSPARVAQIKAEQAVEVQKTIDEKLKIESQRQLQIDVIKDLFDSSKSAPQENPFGGNPFGGNSFDGGKPFAKKSYPEPEKTTAVENIESKTPNYSLVATKAATKKKLAVSYKDKLPEYPGFFLFTEKERLKKVTYEPELEKYEELIDKMDSPKDTKERRMSNSSATSGSALNPETSKIARMLNDSCFENFSSVVAQNPSQVLRYDLGGSPLLYCGKDEVAKTVRTSTIPDPAYNPSSYRQFELQLMPKAIMDLELCLSKLIKDVLEGMSWGTIIVATDYEDGVSSLDENYIGYVVEYCGVQWEESV